ncbi:hypothetical protein GCK72_019638 [Caenorhabditis remanei]|uniref:Uncharacterized protein n=1 Tax=Caenorhabditis remanei TaxID=31234 RepID=A0A6A5GF10_CAERE|nr:hypothetical protein GCK72_019638 [Caenorhabditis remanei]KAF1753082.1 hypothetical protein GCK72_019638 [Caenorhabditis remanei]
MVQNGARGVHRNPRSWRHRPLTTAFLKSAFFEYCFITYKDFNNAHEIPTFFGLPYFVDPNNTTVQRWSFKYPNSCKDNLLIVVRPNSQNIHFWFHFINQVHEFFAYSSEKESEITWCAAV